MSDKWLRAATIGSIWASMEIIAGSFLHNLHLPLAGSVLSFFAVMLMVSFLRMWPQKGIIWRAGLICALMKSISPSAVILGPMTGILMEALVMELAILLLGVNLIGVIAGGMLAVFSALIHKAVNLLILYGSDFAGLLNSLVVYAAKQLRTESVSGADILIVLAGIYLIAGLLAAISGWKLAGSLNPDGMEKNGWYRGHESANKLFGYSTSESYSVWLLAGHIAAVFGCLVAMNRTKLQWWVLPVVLYLLFCLLRYKRAVYQLLRPKFWIFMVLITMLSTILLESLATSTWFGRAGFVAGIMMNVRALFLLMAFTAIASELKNPLIKTILFKKGFAGLYKSVSLSFAILPGVINMRPPESRSRLQFRLLLRSYLLRAEEIFLDFKNMEASLPGVYLIVGDREEGKSTYLRHLVDELGGQGKKISGFIAEGRHGMDGNRTGFDIKDIETGEVAEFCVIDGGADWERVGRFKINPAGLARGNAWMAPERISGSDLLVIDELGPLELAGKGWAGLIGDILRYTPKPMIWTVRRSLADKMAVKWNVGKVTMIDVAEPVDAARIF